MKKILFNDKFGLTQAVLEGRKTQTRRNFTLALHKKADRGDALIEVSPSKVFFEDGKWKFVYDDYAFLLPKINYPKYKIGEVVAVAQSYKDTGVDFIEYDVRNGHNHLWGNTKGMKGWNNKMFVLPEAMPNRIRITNVLIQRLQDISGDDCLKEGIIERWHVPAYKNYYYIPGVEVKSVKDVYNTPKEAFARLIDKVNKKGTWDSNPYVWVYDFELVRGCKDKQIR